MTDQELSDHLEYVDGIQKAQMVALRLLLTKLPDIKNILRDKATQLPGSMPTQLSDVQLNAMRSHLALLTS
jgi:hypothetical protein